MGNYSGRLRKLQKAMSFGPGLVEHARGFYPGNQYAKLAKTSEHKFQPGPQKFTYEQWQRRAEGRLKAWNIRAKINAGKRVMTAKKKQAAKNRRWLTLAKEAREIQQRAREYAWMGIEELAKIIENPNTQGAVKVSAIALMHERAYGKPLQTNVNANMDANGKPSELGPDELDARVAQTLKRIENLTGRARKETASPQQPIDVRKLN